MEDVRPGVLQYFRFDICIFVFLVFFFFGVSCIYLREGIRYLVVQVLFLLLYVVQQKTSSLEKGKRNEKQSNEHIEIFCCFCFNFFFFRDCRYENTFALEFWFRFKGASRLETSCLTSELKLVFFKGFYRQVWFLRKVNA